MTNTPNHAYTRTETDLRHVDDLMQGVEFWKCQTEVESV